MVRVKRSGMALRYNTRADSASAVRRGFMSVIDIKRLEGSVPVYEMELVRDGVAKKSDSGA